jgi:succinylglutamate desuccinylase
MREESFIEYTIGNESSPHIAIIGCVHGDEVIGKKVIDKLRSLTLKAGSITFIIANKRAITAKKRFISRDLNRSFPGKRAGVYEEQLAYVLHQHLQTFDLVIDIHATNSNIDSLGIITKLNKQIRLVLKYLPIKKVALIKQKVFGGHELISHCKTGISLEYGPDKSGRNYKLALKHVRALLINMGVLAGKKNYYSSKILYTLTDRYTINKKFKQNPNLNDFKLIKKGEIIGHLNKKTILSNKTFYPIFLGMGKYKKTLALIALHKKPLTL